MGSINFGGIEFRELDPNNQIDAKILERFYKKRPELKKEIKFSDLNKTGKEVNLNDRSIKIQNSTKTVSPQNLKTLNKTDIKIKDNKPSFKISYYDLPLSFQKEVKNEIFFQSSVLRIILFKIILISFEISDQGIDEVKDLLTHLHLLPLQILDLSVKRYKNRFDDPLIYEFIKTSFNNLLLDISSAMPLVSEKSQEHFKRIYDLIFDLNQAYKPNEKPIFLNLKLSEISELYSMDDSKSMEETISALQKQINLTLKFFNYIYKTILKDNQVFSSKYSEYKPAWENSENLYKKIKKYILLKRKKEITFLTFENILNKLETEITRFHPAAQIFSSGKDLTLFNDVPNKSILNYEKYSYVNLLEKNNTLQNELLAEKEIISNTYILKTIFGYIPEFVTDMFEKTLSILTIYCHNKNLEISTDEMNILFDKLNMFIKKINNINISFKTNFISEKGVENGNQIFKLLNLIVNNLDRSWKIYNLNHSTVCISHIYKDLYYFRFQINNNLSLNLKTLSEEIAILKNQIDLLDGKNKKQIIKFKKKFERSLLNISLFKEILVEYYYPIENIINNFEKTFLVEKKNELSQETSEKVDIVNLTIKQTEIEVNKSEEPISLVEELLKEKSVIQTKETIDEKIPKAEDSFKNEKPLIDDEKLFKNESSAKTEEKLEKITVKSGKKRRKKQTKKISEIDSTDVKEDFNSKIELLTNSLAQENDHQSLRNVKFLDLIQEVIDHGFLFLKQTGSHVNFKNPEHPELGIVTVPRHDVISKGVVKEVRNKLNKKST